MLSRRFFQSFERINQIIHQQFNKCRTSSFSHKAFSVTNDFYDKSSIEELAAREIAECCVIRKTKGDINEAQELLNKLCSTTDEECKKIISNQLREELRKIPNRTHPVVLGYGDVEKPVEIASYGTRKDAHTKVNVPSKAYEKVARRLKGKLVEMKEICYGLNIMRTGSLTQFLSHKSYYLYSDLAEMEQALIRYTIDYLTRNGFELISVPDILPENVIKACGMETETDSHHAAQVFRLDPTNLCLSGTSEMALGGFISGKTFKRADMPKKYMAVSRCYRAEAREGRGIYRVHYFTKVEMFSICLPTQSEEILEQFNDIQTKLFASMGLHFKVFDMPIKDLGAPAYRKYDVEAWMPGVKMYGEISSSSNCTDFQSKRLNVFTEDSQGNEIHAHTVNGTACAVPRMLTAILEQFQQPLGTIDIPEVLQKYMGGTRTISQKRILPRQY